MDDEDLDPVAAIALFLVISSRCAQYGCISAGRRAEIAETESTQIWYSEEQAESLQNQRRKGPADPDGRNNGGEKADG